MVEGSIEKAQGAWLKAQGKIKKMTLLYGQACAWPAKALAKEAACPQMIVQDKSHRKPT